MSKVTTTTFFKVAPDYTIAHQAKGSHYICLDEWTGRSFEDFTQAMGRPADSVKTTVLSRGPITEYVWCE